MRLVRFGPGCVLHMLAEYASEDGLGSDDDDVASTAAKKRSRRARSARAGAGAKLQRTTAVAAGVSDWVDLHAREKDRPPHLTVGHCARGTLLSRSALQSLMMNTYSAMKGSVRATVEWLQAASAGTRARTHQFLI